MNTAVILALCALMGVATAGTVRDKRWLDSYDHSIGSLGYEPSLGYASSYDSHSLDYAAPLIGYPTSSIGYTAPSLSYSAPALSLAAPALPYSAPAASVVAVNKVVNVAREVNVPHVVNVRKLVSEPQIVTVKKIVPSLSHSSLVDAYSPAYASSYGW